MELVQHVSYSLTAMFWAHCLTQCHYAARCVFGLLVRYILALPIILSTFPVIL